MWWTQAGALNNFRVPNVPKRQLNRAFPGPVRNLSQFPRNRIAGPVNPHPRVRFSVDLDAPGPVYCPFGRRAVQVRGCLPPCVAEEGIPCLLRWCPHNTFCPPPPPHKRTQSNKTGNAPPGPGMGLGWGGYPPLHNPGPFGGPARASQAPPHWTWGCRTPQTQGDPCTVNLDTHPPVPHNAIQTRSGLNGE